MNWRTRSYVALGVLVGTLVTVLVGELAGRRGLQSLAAVDVLGLVVFSVLRGK